MADFKKMYTQMFNAATDAERLVAQAAHIIRTAQAQCEELYTEAEDTPLSLTDESEE